MRLPEGPCRTTIRAHDLARPLHLFVGRGGGAAQVRLGPRGPTVPALRRQLRHGARARARARRAGRAAAEPTAGIALAVATGVLYVLGFLVFKRTITEAGTGIATSVSRLSVTLPVLISVIAFGELVGGWQTARYRARDRGPAAVRKGVAAASRGAHHTPARALLDAGGVRDLRAQRHRAQGSGGASTRIRSRLFFAILFGTAGVISVALALVRRQRFRLRTLLGLPLGAVNYGTAHFLALALGRIPGPGVHAQQRGRHAHRRTRRTIALRRAARAAQLPLPRRQPRGDRARPAA